MINLTPGVTRDVAFGGAAQTSNVIAVDGVRLTEPYTGLEGMSVAYNWVDQVQVGALGAPAEVGEFTGAVANAVLHSGGNQFNGLGEFNAAVPGWTGNNTGGVDTTNVPPPRQTRNAWEASGQLGGPLRQNRLWFFGGFADKGQAFRAFGFSGPGYTEEHAPQWIFKLDAALTNSVRLQGFYDGDRSTTIGDGLWEFAPTLEAAGDAHDRNHAWNVSATWTPDSRTLLEVRSGGHTGESRLDPHPPASGTGPPAHIDVITGVTTGNI